MCRCHRRDNTFTNDSSARPSSSDDTDLFDDLWNSIADTASEFTRSLVGLPMFYRRTLQNRAPPDEGVITIFAEPGILTPEIITFHLDKDVAGFYTPFRFISRPVTVFDVFTQGWRNQEGKCEAGMMFLFGTPLENSKWLVAPGLKVIGSSMFHRPWNNPNEWIRRRLSPLPNISPCLRAFLTDWGIAFNALDNALNDLDEYLDSIDQGIDEWGKGIDSQDRSPRHPPKSPFESFGKRFEDAFQHLKDHEPAKDINTYSTETSTTTHITRNADGSVHEETTTTERLPDGSTKTTKLVKTPQGETRTETIVNKPFIKERFRALPRPEESTVSANGAETMVPSVAAGNVDNKGNADRRDNRAWWFWSRK